MTSNYNDIELNAHQRATLRCTHQCHDIGLNPWVEECPICGCENPTYDPEAVPDIVRPRFFGVFDND